MVRMLFVISDCFPAWRYDVAELFSHELPARGFEVVWSLWREEPGKAGWCEQNNQLFLLPYSFGNRSNLAKLGTRFCRVIADLRLFAHIVFAKRYDLIQVRDRRFFAALLAWFAARLRGSKFVIWLSYPFPEHDIETARELKGAKQWWLTFRGHMTTFLLYRILMHLADHIFVQSEQMKRDITTRYGVACEKMTPVPMGVPRRLVDWQAENKIEIVPGRVIYVGTLAKIRRLETLIEAFAQVYASIPSAELYIVGDGDVPNERQALEASVYSLNLQNAVHFTGFVPAEDVWRFIASGAVCVSPFYPTFVLRSTSPTKLNEYMALGRPCVANDHPEQAVTLQQSRAGLCVPWSAKDFAIAIIQLLEHPAEAEIMGQRGPAWVLGNRTYDRIADVVHHTYSVLLSRAT